MTREEFLKEYRTLVKRNEKAAQQNERAAASNERSANTMVGVIKAEREIIVHQHNLTDDLMGAISGLNELSKGFSFLLNQTSIKLMEKNIHQLIGEYETQQERGKQFEPGVPKEILNGVGK